MRPQNFGNGMFLSDSFMYISHRQRWSMRRCEILLEKRIISFSVSCAKSVCNRGLHRPGPSPRPVPFRARGPGWQMRGNFPTGWAGPANDGWFFPMGRAGTWGVIFRMGRAGLAKREMSFLTAGSGYKKRKTNNITSQFGLRKQRQSFETDR